MRRATFIGNIPMVVFWGTVGLSSPCECCSFAYVERLVTHSWVYPLVLIKSYMVIFSGTVELGFQWYGSDVVRAV